MSSAVKSTMPKDGQRDPIRPEFRDNIRQKPREPHEVYAIDRQDQPRDMDLMWAALKVRGAPNQDRLNEFIRTGWRPARAQDYPDHSGYDVNANYSQTLIDLGFARRIAPDDPVVNRDLMLMIRPKEMSRESRAEDQARADGQINDHMNRLRQVSARQIGERNTTVRRQVSRSDRAPPDLVSDDADVELG
jgi:hypothetical protein